MRRGGDDDLELELGGVVGNSEAAEGGGWGPSRGRKRNEDEQVKEETSKVQNVKWLAPETERGGLDSYATRLVCRVVCSACTPENLKKYTKETNFTIKTC